MTLSIESNTATVLSPQIKLKHIVQSLPKEVFAKDNNQAFLMAVKTIVAVTVGMVAIAYAPWYLLPLAWVFTGTAMTGCFVIGHDCAHRSFSKSRKVNDIVGHLIFV